MVELLLNEVPTRRRRCQDTVSIFAAFGPGLQWGGMMPLVTRRRKRRTPLWSCCVMSGIHGEAPRMMLHLCTP